MANDTAWVHFREATNLMKRIDRLGKEAKEINRIFESLKVDILNNTKLKAELKKIIDIYPGLTIEKLLSEYTRFKNLHQYMQDNGYI